MATRVDWSYHIPRDSDGSPEAYAWPGGYPLYYVCRDGGALCPKCVKAEEPLAHDNCPREQCREHDPQWCIIGHGINWEDPDLYCDHCGSRIESAYAEPEEDE